nr:stromal 70 kda heat shock-related protein, chloroplastic [Quercus suber]
MLHNTNIIEKKNLEICNYKKINRLNQMKTVSWSDVAKFLRLEMEHLRQTLQCLIETAKKAKMELSSLTQTNNISLPFIITIRMAQNTLTPH